MGRFGEDRGRDTPWRMRPDGAFASPGCAALAPTRDGQFRLDGSCPASAVARGIFRQTQRRYTTNDVRWASVSYRERAGALYSWVSQ
jgi:hypothetical protein